MSGATPGPCPAGGEHVWTDDVDERFTTRGSMFYAPTVGPLALRQLRLSDHHVQPDDEHQADDDDQR